MKDKLIEIILWLGFVAAACILIGPNFIDSLYNIQQVQSIGSYADDVTDMDEEEIQNIIQRVTEYNAKIAQQQAESAFTYLGSDLTDEEYTSLLMMGTEKNIMGYVEVPSARIYLPIAHGTDAHLLTYEAGHMYGTSMPIGGKSTHAIIAAHTGLKSADLFTHLTDTKEGDVFYIHVLNEIHEYTVDQIEVVLPEDEDPYLQIVPGEDYVTLYTCTPYGINDHRLLVRGKRTGNVEVNAEGGETILNQRMNREAIIRAILFASIPFLVLIIGGILVFKKKKNPNALIYVPKEAYDLFMENIKDASDLPYCESSDNLFYLSEESYIKFRELITKQQPSVQKKRNQFEKEEKQKAKAAKKAEKAAHTVKSGGKKE